jgi:hypothetical protein
VETCLLADSLLALRALVTATPMLAVSKVLERRKGEQALTIQNFVEIGNGGMETLVD